jgi:hypothetical protein
VSRQKVQVEVDLSITPRDYLMARIAAARATAQVTIDACDEIISLCLDPGEDPKLADRSELLSDALDMAGATARALEDAERVIDQVDPVECEPWDEDGDEVDEDEPEDEEPEIPRAAARPRRRS